MADQEMIQEKIGEALGLEKAAQKAVEDLDSRGLLKGEQMKKLSKMKEEANQQEEEMQDLVKNNVRLIATGKIEQLSPRRRHILEKAIRATRDNTGLTLNLALNYSGRTEIIEAVRALSRLVKEDGLQASQIDEKLFSQYLYTKSMPDPDLLIRTSGEMRLSNFLLWQTSYTELYVTEVLWPDFTEENFYQAIWEYQGRERRFGRL